MALHGLTSMEKGLQGRENWNKAFPRSEVNSMSQYDQGWNTCTCGNDGEWTQNKICI